MKRCRHRRQRPLVWMGGGWVGASIVSMEWHAIVCSTCAHWLPLGPARDDLAAVFIEMRAAELAAGFGPMSGSERTGWADYIRDTEPLSMGNEAGWLAAHIATHEEE